MNCTQIKCQAGATASIEAVEVTSEVEPDNELAAALEKYTGGQFKQLLQ